jgi:hypothetical protein
LKGRPEEEKPAADFPATGFGYTLVALRNEDGYIALSG